MNTIPGHRECPHCDNELQVFELPADSEWQGENQLACFNDECPYYQRGWAWMQEKYGMTASYRYRIDPGTNRVSPLAVKSPTALKDRILDTDNAEDGREDQSHE